MFLSDLVPVHHSHTPSCGSVHLVGAYIIITHIVTYVALLSMFATLFVLFTPSFVRVFFFFLKQDIRDHRFYKSMDVLETILKIYV